MTDRELDAMVAERVMGKVPRQVRAKGSDEVVTVYTNNPAVVDGVFSATDLHLHGDPDRYSEYAAVAWLAIERMRARDWLPSISFAESKKWWVTFVQLKNGRVVGEASGEDESMPKAASLAALRAVGCEVGT